MYICMYIYYLLDTVDGRASAAAEWSTEARALLQVLEDREKEI